MALLVGVVLLASPATAEPQAKSPVALAPATTVGGVPNKGLRALETLLEQGIASISGANVIAAEATSDIARKAKRPELRACDGDVACLGELGKLAGAETVVYAEVSDLGDAQVIYLKAVDVSTSKELRSTTLKLDAESNRQRQSKAAAAQLLAPDTFAGTLDVKTPVDGATIFLDGHKIGTTPAAPTRVFVGSHALRVTHPEHRDYVRFVDVNFEEGTVVNAELLRLPGLDQKLSVEGVVADGTVTSSNVIIKHRERPWYYRWYTITGGVAIIAITSAVIVGGGDTLNADLIRDL